MSFSYPLKNIVPLELPLDNHPHILILHADKQPVHVAFVWNELYYSLTYKGPETAIPLSTRLKLIRIRRIPCLWLKLNLPLISINKERINSIFNQYPPLNSSETCLTPIWDFLQIAYSIPSGKPLIFGLLDSIAEHKLLLQIASFQLDNIVNGEFSLPYYSSESVENRITLLASTLKKKF